MSKQVFKYGFFDHELYHFGYPLVSGSVDRNPTRIDVSDTNNNNDIIRGRKVWTFNVQIISDNVMPVSPDSAPVHIAISIGSEIYDGYGMIISISHQGNLDNRIIYNVSGEMFPYLTYECWYGSDVNNALHWADDDINNTPDGWNAVFLTPTITSDYYGKYVNLVNNGVYTFNTSKVFTLSDYHFYYVRYQASGMSGFNISLGTTSINLANFTSYPTIYRAKFLPVSGDDEINWNGTGSNGTWKIYRSCFCKLIDSLT